MSPSEYIDYQKANKFDETMFGTNSSGMQSAKRLARNGQNANREIFQSKIQAIVKDNKCYSNRYSDLLHDLMYQRQIDKQKKENEAFATEKAECQASKECMAKREIDAASYTLNNVYYSLMARYPYQQAD
jgi:hypothetical protein